MLLALLVLPLLVKWLNGVLYESMPPTTSNSREPTPLGGELEDVEPADDEADEVEEADDEANRPPPLIELVPPPLPPLVEADEIGEVEGDAE